MHRNFLRPVAAAALAALAPFAADAARPAPGNPQLPDFDEGSRLPAVRSAALASNLGAYVSRHGYRTSIDEDTGSVFLWAAGNRQQALQPLPGLSGRALHEARARQFLQRHAAELQLSARSIQEALLHDLHDQSEGPLIARFNQRRGGVEVFGRTLNVSTDRNGRLVAISGLFAPDDGRTAQAPRFALSARQAVGTAFANLGGEALPSLASAGMQGEYAHFRRAAGTGALQLLDDPRAKKVLYPMGRDLVPAYYVEVSAGLRDDARRLDYSFVVSAVDGAVLSRHNQVSHAAYSYRTFANSNAAGLPFDGPLGNDKAPFAGRTFDEPITRTAAGSKLVTIESSSALPTRDPWLPEGAQTTSGNNVDAYLDLGGGDGYSAATDLRPQVTSANTFNYPLIADADPSTEGARSAAAVNLFYTNNVLHDIWYASGFNEAAGNAQRDNFGRGGQGNDPILAEGQDASGRNNANMSTPADGRSPRMQMFVWDGLPRGSYAVTQPAPRAQTLVYSNAGFGPTTFDITGLLATVADGEGTPSDGCTAPLNAAALAGKIALIDRGNCDFTQKVRLAQQAGAIGATIVNNAPGTPIVMGGTDASITIPSMMITQADGTALKAATKPVTVRMERLASIDLDGTLDTGIVAHEFFHFVSNRLVGNGNGLSNPLNSQGGGMGEGWSDFATMVLQVRANDVNVPGNADWSGAYSVGGYVTNSFYFGIRRTPYSTDFAKNPLTFRHIQNGEALPTTAPLAYGQDGATNNEVHNTGEIWCNVLWEAYVGFLKDDRYDFNQARSKVMGYVIAGLKMTPNSPTMLQARDAILSAADASDDQDFMIWANAFAKRGMGVGARGPGALKYNNQGVTESYVAAEPRP